MEPKPDRFKRLRQYLRRGWNAGVHRVLGRESIGWTLAVLVLACFVAAVGAAVIVLASGLTLDQKLVALGDTFTLGAFTLAVIGAGVALLAYRLALQRPKLVVHIVTEDYEEGTIHVGLDRPDDTGERHIRRLPGYRRHGEGLVLRISVENTSDWSARNVAVRVDFNSMRRVPHANGWAIAAYHHTMQNEIVALQWEGGADFAIHGRWTRELPDLFLNESLVEAPGDECSVVIDVVAEGFRQAWTYPVQWRSQVDMQGKAGGAISGFAGYPSSGVPPLRIYAIPLTGRHAWRAEIVLGYGYRWFWIDDVEPGEYHIVAYREGNPNQRGAYTVGSRDNDLTATMNHSLVPVVVKRTEVTDGVRITDWYYDKFPPEPDVR